MDIEKIQQKLLQDFDFERVHNIMVATNWEWALVDGGRVPEIDELKVFALRLVRETIQSSESNQGIAVHASGGFSVTVLNGVVRLEFIVESCGVSMA